MDNVAHQTSEQVTAPGSVELLPFASLVFSFTAWAVLVVLFFPRLLGRVCSFVVNRASGGNSYISIPTLHIYPLAGRVVAHSVKYTNVNFTASTEECVLQFRWWRRHEPLNTTKDQILSSESPEDFNSVALQQQQIDQQNQAKFLKRSRYKLRRWCIVQLLQKIQTMRKSRPH